MSRVSTQPSTIWRSGWLLAALIAVAALALIVSQARPTAAQTAAEITLTKTVAEPVVALDGTVTFTITINNTSTSPVAMGDLTITDDVPGLINVTAEPTTASDEAVYFCPPVEDNVVSCSNSEGAHAANGETHSITVTGTADIRGEHSNVVTGTLDVAGEPVDLTASAPVPFTIESSNIAIVKTADVGEAGPGEQIEFTITITNAAGDGVVPAAVGAVEIADTLPDGLDPLVDANVEVTGDVAYDCDITGGLTVECDNTDVHGVGATATVTITATVVADPEAGEYTNTATATATGQADIEPASATYTIQTSNIAIEKTANADQADPGEQVVFTITITNEAGDGVVPAGVGAVDIADTLPDVFDPLVDANVVGVNGDVAYDCDITGGLTVECDNTEVHAVGDEATIIITATVAADAVLGDHTNTATATASGQAAIGNATADFTIGEEIERTIAIVKRIDGDDAPALTSVSGTIAPHEPSAWTIDLSGDTSDIEIDGVSGDEQTVTETSPGADWIVEYVVVSPEATCADGDQGVQEGEWSSDPAVVPAGEGSYVVCIRNTYDPADVDEHTYLLTFRWSLIAWISPDMPIEDALRGEGQNEGGTNVFDDVTVIWAWDGQAQDWLGFFTAGVDQPGANDLEMFEFGAAYWIAIEGPADISWTVMEREAGNGEEDENGED